jgi:predicted DnaQ family exonuclease/DinG family helicase
MFWDSFSFVTLDIETTGLDPQKSEIIEIGAVRFVKGVKKDEFNVLIKPSIPVPTMIKQLTGIKESDLEEGVSSKQALSGLLNYLKDDLVICHNSSFDVTFIRNGLTIHMLPSLDNPVYDTLELARVYLPFLNNHKLATVAAALQIKPEKKYHRAVNDAFITGQVFVQLTNFVLEYIPFELNSSLLEIAQYAEHSSDLEDYFRRIIDYQRRFALIKNKPDDYLRLYQSPLAPALGFIKSHNLIRTDNWFQESEESPAGDVFSGLTEAKIPKDTHENSGVTDPAESIVNLSFEEKGYFAERFPGYEYREGQIEMAQAIDHALNNDEFLIVEAGTGIGKTLAYLVTALHFAHKRAQKVFVSTNTKNLQEQLFFKDLPIIKQCVPVPFQAVILKGRENYLCTRKWNEIRLSFRKTLSPSEAANLVNLLVWQQYTRSGDISENSSFSRESTAEVKRQYSSLWKKIAAERYFCSGRRCSEYGKCYYMKVRHKAEKSSLIVTNHSLLLTDLSFDRFGNKENNYLIIDEAHNLPEMASSYLGLSLSYSDLTNFFHQLAHINIRRNLQTGILPGLKTAIQKSVIDDTKKGTMITDVDYLILSLDDKKNLISDFFTNIAGQVKEQGSFGKLRIKKKEDYLVARLEELISFLTGVFGRLFNLSQFLLQINKNQISDYDEHQERLAGAIEKAKDLIEGCKILKEPDFNDYAFWLSSFSASEQNYPSGVLNYAPLDVSSYLQKSLYSRVNALIFTSATLALRDSFKFFRLRMGLTTTADKITRELIINSPFDFDKQTLVLAASYLPIPSDDYFMPQSIQLLKMTIDSARVGAMVLFTSYKDLNTVYDKVSDEFYRNDVLLLAQGKGYSRTVALNEFRQDGKAVLLGTSSFWEGVDVPGDSLSLLILYKLPFQVPSEPLIEAYHEKLRKEGKDPFMHSTLPNALLRFRQGFGRLIRNKKDRGVVLVIDSRVVNKFYGRFFREILPTDLYQASTPEEVCDLVAGWFNK